MTFFFSRMLKILHRPLLVFKSFDCDDPRFNSKFSVFFFRGEVVNGGFGLVLDGSQVSFIDEV